MPNVSPLTTAYDLAVIGGGINGTGIAADAAGRGLSVLLIEREDLAQHTSSASSKLIHGGLRYLEQFHLRLVREALAEREVLLSKAPHIIQPLRFVLPHQKHLRPAWMIRCGLFLYDHLAQRRHLAASHAVTFTSNGPLKPTFKHGFEYTDCQVDDARLVILNAMAARERHAHIHTRMQCTALWRHADQWQLQLQDRWGNMRKTQARALINACGPWVDTFSQQHQLTQRAPSIRLVRGSHIVVPRLQQTEHAYILQHDDQRIVFVIPWLDKYSLIGTTDCDYQGEPADVSISQAEIDYLLHISNQYFRQQLSSDDIRHCFSGVRPLYDQGAAQAAKASRDYHFELHDIDSQTPLLNVFGGKLTTYRKLAEAAVNQLTPYFEHMGPTWTHNCPLPGAEGFSSAELLTQQLLNHAPWLEPAIAQRWATHYGTRSWRLLEGAQCLTDLGLAFGAGLYQAEVEYLRAEEWAISAEDILWRRSKLGLSLSDREQQRLTDYLNPCLTLAQSKTPD